MKNQFLLVLLTFLGLQLTAQKINNTFQYSIKKATSGIVIDGKLDETAWKNCETTSDFWMITPADTAKATIKTEAKFTYDDN